MRTILHVDMDAFFASVEQRDDPALRGRPVIVGGPSRRGVVCAASYEARPTGVRSAMPMAEALRRCPDAIVVAPRHDRYGAVSDDVFAIFRRFTPLVEGLSVDEAFLDVTASRGLFGDGEAIAGQIRAAIREELDLTASAGVAPSKFVAKIASDFGKPDGLTVVPPEAVARFLRPLDLARMWGVGPKAEARLRSLGFETFADLADADPDRLERLLGSWGRTVHALARGEDERGVEPERAAKSIGAEQTYERDLVGRQAVERSLLAHATRVARRLHGADLRAGKVTVKVKYADFTVKTRQAPLDPAADDATSLFEAGRRLLERFPLAGRPVRLTGLSAGDLRSGPAEPSLFDLGQRDKRSRVQAATAAIEERYGKLGITRAALLEGDGEGTG
jgi:DNA polymerase-4